MNSHGDSFYWSPQVTILLKPVNIHTPLALFAASVILALLSVLYEGLRCLRVNLAERDAARRKGELKMLSPSHAIQTILHLAEFCFSYILMLSVMTFNGWLFISIVVGSTVGFQLCRVYSLPHGTLRSVFMKGSEEGKQFEIEEKIPEKPFHNGSETHNCGGPKDTSPHTEKLVTDSEQCDDSSVIPSNGNRKDPGKKNLDDSEYDSLLPELDSEGKPVRTSVV